MIVIGCVQEIEKRGTDNIMSLICSRKTDILESFYSENSEKELKVWKSRKSFVKSETLPTLFYLTEFYPITWELSERDDVRYV